MPDPLQNPVHSPALAATRPGNRLVLVLLALLPAVAYLYIVWTMTANTPDGDGYIQSIFTVLYYREGNSLAEKFASIWWTYFQHRGLASKIVTLAIYLSLGHLDIHWLGMIGNFSLCVMALLVSCNICQQRWPAYLLPVPGLMILSLYPWSVATWPECTLFYFLTLMLAMACFHCLDLARPHMLLAAACSWLATLTMANGILSLMIGSMIVLWNHHRDHRYSRSQIVGWFGSAIACMVVHFATMNVFSTDLFGAKTVQASLSGIPGRLVDFLESLGATPFPPHAYHEEKVLFGSFVLAWLLVILPGRASRRSPAVSGLLLFATGTIFLTSLFRYSAGDNNGYQVFTSTILACLIVLSIANLSLDKRKENNQRFLPIAVLLMATLFNLNALVSNREAMAQKADNLTLELEQFLVDGNTDPDNWHHMFLQAALAADIYRPLQSHQRLPLPVAVTTAAACPAADSAFDGSVSYRTAPTAFGMKITVSPSRTIPTGQPLSVLLCGSGNYRITLQDQPDTIVLLDKRQFAAGNYQVLVEADGHYYSTGTSLAMAPPAAYQLYRQDCKTIHWVATNKAFSPLRDYFCALKDP